MMLDWKESEFTIEVFKRIKGKFGLKKFFEKQQLELAKFHSSKRLLTRPLLADIAKYI